MMAGILKDLRFALRMIGKRPGLSAAAGLTIALGIGATTMVFSVVNGVLLQPLPYPDADRLFVLAETHPKLFSANRFVSPRNFRDWRARNQVFEEMSAWQRTSMTLTGGGAPRRLATLRVSQGFFRLMGMPLHLGRGFLPSEDRPGGAKVAVLSHALWLGRFEGDPSVLGTTLTLDDEPHRVVGVADPRLRFTGDAEIWAPLALDYETWPRDLRWAGVIGRLASGVSVSAARGDMDRVAAQLEQEFPESNAGWRVSLLGLRETMVRNVRPALLMLMSAVIFVLAIAVANVAHLLLSRGAARRREVAIRQAIGASRPRMVRQLLTESLVLGLCGGGLGLLLAAAGTQAVLRLLAVELPRAAEVGVDVSVLCFATAVSLVSGLAFGTLPALQMSAASMAEHLREAGRSVAGSLRGARLRRSLVAGEVALALVLVVGATLLTRTLLSLLSTDPGFDAAHVLTAPLDLPRPAYPRGEAQAAFVEAVLERVRVQPGVEAAGAVFPMPMVGAVAPSPLVIEGASEPGADVGQETPFWLATAGYFEAMRIPLLRGRYLGAGDTAAGPPVAVVNRTFTDRFFPGEDAVGRRIALGRMPVSQEQWLTIVGVVGDVHHDRLAGEPGPQLYLSFPQSPFSSATLAVRAAGDPTRLADEVRAAVSAVDPSLPVTRLRTAREIVSGTLGDERFSMALLSLFALLALALAATGIYGVLSSLLEQRRREVGVRTALGASRGRLMRLMLSQALGPVLAGIVLGVAAALGLGRLLESRVHGVGPIDPVSIGGTVLLLLAVALLASLLPAWRATRVDPMVVLRCD